VKVPLLLRNNHVKCIFKESRSLRLERKVGEKFHLKLNINGVSIVYKYREGKTKRTLKRELKGTEIAVKEAESFSNLAKLGVSVVELNYCWCCSFEVTVEEIVFPG
jgi:hypothetical protein